MGMTDFQAQRECGVLEGVKSRWRSARRLGRLAAPPGQVGAAPPARAEARTPTFPFVSRRLR